VRFVNIGTVQSTLDVGAYIKFCVHFLGLFSDFNKIPYKKSEGNSLRICEFHENHSVCGYIFLRV
jgi:hypothetical protein